MTKAKQYGLNFTIVRISGFLPQPNVECSRDNNGYGVNYEIASFVESGGVKFTTDLLNDINRLISPNDYAIIGGDEVAVVRIFSSPLRAVFNIGGGDVTLPLQDFIDILNEWKTFLQSLNFQHALSNQ
jgi:hypothetical protein